MYAVIETGGKQYRVEVGTQLEVELLDIEPGADMQFERVLLVADGDTAAIGRPLVENASVAARVVGHDRGDKVISFKYRPKARRRVKKGHRQELTVLRISDIVLDGHSAAADVEAAEAARQRDRSKLEEAARRQAAADAELAAKLAADKPAAPKRGASSSETKASTDAAAAAPKGRATRGAGKASDSESGGGARASSAKSGSAKTGSRSATTSRSSTSASGEKTTSAKASGTQSRKTQAGGAESAAPKTTAKPRSKKES
jgi:large subunit ribosomal protein L21